MTRNRGLKTKKVVPTIQNQIEKLKFNDTEIGKVLKRIEDAKVEKEKQLNYLKQD
jgi:hypothetical protein